MDLLAALPQSPPGRHTTWLWSRMLALADGGPPFDPAELADHFDPSVLDHVLVQHLVAQYAAFAPTMALVTQVIEETSSDGRYCALDGWLRYTCVVQGHAPHLLLVASYLPAMDPNAYSDRRIRRDGRDVHIRDFGGDGPLMLLWHGAGADLTWWEALVPHLGGFHVVAQDLPCHGRSPLTKFTAEDALADADAVIRELGEGPPIVVGQSLGGYLGLRYAATRGCSGWIGLDGPFGIAYPWEEDEPEDSEFVLQINREMRAIDVAGSLAALHCPAMLMLCEANPIYEELLLPARRELAEHIARHHSHVRIEWVRTDHNLIVFHQPEKIAALMRDLLTSHGV